MEVADTLSRAACTTAKSEFEEELETVCAVDCQLTDPVLQRIAKPRNKIRL